MDDSEVEKSCSLKNHNLFSNGHEPVLEHRTKTKKGPGPQEDILSHITASIHSNGFFQFLPKELDSH